MDTWTTAACKPEEFFVFDSATVNFIAIFCHDINRHHLFDAMSPILAADEIGRS
jgi:hypothetical protein